MVKYRLRDEKYEYIKRMVTKTLKECNINTIPINPFSICKSRGYKLIRYSDKYTREEMDIVCERCPNGFNYYIDGVRVIEYNDSLTIERIRTTLFHEIGHIELKHTCSCSLAEAEAEWFGVYMIAPPPLVDLFQPEDSEELAAIFDTSTECGYHSMNRYIKWKKCSWFLKDYEKELIKQFYDNRELLVYEDEVMEI